MRITTALTTLALLLFAPAAAAVPENGDAGERLTTAQNLAGMDVDRIDGSFADGVDVDLYRLCLPGGGSFSASTVDGTAVDTQLFLFDASGRAVYGSDDVGDLRQSRLPAGHALTPGAQGEYLLAVVPFNRDPASWGGAMFSNEGDPLTPTGAGAQPLDGWFGRAGASGAYSVFLTGAYCRPPDTAAPTVDLRSPLDGVEVARGDSVEVDFSCADEPGGWGLASCVGSVADGELLDTSTPGPVSVTVQASDLAGNTSSVTHTVTVVERDTIAPLIDLRSPLDGAVYLLDEPVLADYGCADEEGGSGLVSCVGSLADGAPLDTGSVGPKPFGVTAADAAGNTAAADSVYRVVYDFDGFLWPVRNRPELNRWKAGVPVPIRFELGGNQGVDVIADGWPRVAEVECGSGAEPETGDPARHPRWFKELAFRKRKQRYVLLWKTERDWAGSCRQFMLKLDDGTIKRADFDFTRRRHHWD